MTKTTETITTVVVVIVAFLGVQWLFITCNDHDNPDYFKYNPRHAVNGIDTTYTDDSMYIIKVKIDTVEVLEKEYQPREDPRR